MPHWIRLITAASLLIGALVFAPTARAGTYEVHACNPAVGAGANNSFAGVADNGSTAYADCPAGQGMTVRNVWDGGRSGFLQGAYLIFDAPGGTFVESIGLDAGWQRHDCSWALGVVASGFDLGGRRVWGLPPGEQCDAWQTPGETSFLPMRWNHAINASRVRLESRCGVGVCGRDGVATLRARNVSVRVRDDTPPGLGNGRGALWTHGSWLSGTHGVGFDAADGAGIREAVVSVDGRAVARRTNLCDSTLRAPCPQLSFDESFHTSAFGPDGPHALTIAAVDAAGNSVSDTRTVHIDNTPPDAPKDLVLEGGDGWRSANDFDLRWTVLPPKAGSRVAGAEWELCTSDGRTCQRGGKDGIAISELKDLKLPAPGEYVLKLWLRDEAGNQDPRLTPPPTRLRYDDASPELAFEPLSGDDPTLLAVRTSDRGSGAARGVIELRPVGTDQWYALPTTLDGGRLAARLDDESLADGRYELQARVADHAGNERSTLQRVDGSKAEVALPVRLKTRLRGGLVRRRGKRTVLANSAVVRHGQLVRVRGRLTTPEKNPIQDAEVQAFSQIRDAATPPRLIATVKTSRTGRFSFLIRKGPNRTVQIRYGGTQHVRGATKVVTLNVRSRTSMRPSRRRLVNGETVRFHGRIRTGRIPDQGKLIEIQVWVRGRWRTFATTRAARTGLWRYDYRFDGTRGLQTYRFRAKVPPEAGYPFVSGRSGVVRVRVRGV